MKVLKDFIQFVKKPTEFFLEKLSSKEKLKMLVTLLFFKFVFILVIVYPMKLIIDEYVITIKEQLSDWGVVKMVLAMIIFAPFFEEILFRLPLRYKRNYIFQILDAITGNRIEKMWKKQYPFFFYAFAIAFGLVHISNYENTEALFYWISPLIILSQLLGGVILGYIRLKAGLFWGMLYHGLFNGIIVVIALLFYHNVETISYSDTKIQKFTVHELQYIKKDSQCSEIIKNSNGNLVEVHFNDMNLQGVIDSLDLKKNLKGSDLWIDLDIVAPQGISKEKVLEILEKEYDFE